MKLLLLVLVFCAGFLSHAIWTATVKGRLFGFFYGCYIIIGALVDVGCQLWIDVSKLWRFNKRLRDLNKDEYDFHD